MLLPSPSADAGEGKTTVAVGLGFALGVAAPTVIWDADVRGSSLEFQFGADPARIACLVARRELDTPAASDVAFDKELQPAGRPSGASVLCGVRKPSLRTLMSAGYVEHLIEALRERYRFVVLDMSGERLLLDPAATEQCLADELLGLGVLERLMRDPAVQTIFVNTPTHVRVVRDGRIERMSGVRFESDQQVRGVVKRLAGIAGRTFDESSPTVDLALEDGSRLHAVMPPVSAEYMEKRRGHRLVTQGVEVDPKVEDGVIGCRELWIEQHGHLMRTGFRPRLLDCIVASGVAHIWEPAA
jgi:hypothetical protein